MHLWRNIASCFVAFIASCVYAQQLDPPPNGGGGSTPPIGGAFVTSTITGKDTWRIPSPGQGIGNWYIKEIVHDYALNKWFVNGVMQGNTPAVATGWSSAPTPMTGSLEKQRTCKYTIQIPVEEHRKSIWVAIATGANAGISPNGTCIANNGQGDSMVGDGISWADSHGSHLRKVAIDENGFGEWTVSVYAKASATSTSGMFEASLGAGLERDTRVISLPTNFIMKELTEASTFTMQYMTFGSQNTMATDRYMSFVKIGVEPTKILHDLSVTYKNTEKEVNQPESTDALSLKMDFYKAPPYGLVRTHWVNLDGTPTRQTDGSEYVDLDFTSSYSGATSPSMLPVMLKAKYNSTTEYGSSNSDAGDAPSVPSSVKRDSTKRDETTAVPTVTVTAGQSSGTYESTFNWSDGVEGKTSVNIVYKHVSELAKEQIMEQAHQLKTDAADAFFAVTFGWCDGDEAIVEIQPGYQNEVMLVSGATALTVAFLATNPEVSIPLILVLSCAEAGMAGWLDSTSEFGKVEKTFHRKLDSTYWTVVNFAGLDITTFPTGTTAESLREDCDWQLFAAINETARAQARDIWNDSGYSKRGGKPAWTSPTLATAGNNYEAWYKFYYRSPETNGGS